MKKLVTSTQVSIDFRFQPSVDFYVETSHLICTAEQATALYMESSSGL